MTLTEITDSISTTRKNQSSFPSSSAKDESLSTQEPVSLPSPEETEPSKSTKGLSQKNQEFQIQKIEKELNFSLLKKGSSKNAEKIEKFVRENFSIMVGTLISTGETQKKTLLDDKKICELKVRFYHGEVQVLVKSDLGSGAFKSVEKVVQLAGPHLPHQPGPIYAYAKIEERKKLRSELKGIDQQISEALISEATMSQVTELKQKRTELQERIERVQKKLLEEVAISKDFPDSDIVQMWAVTNQKDPTGIKGVMMELCDKGELWDYISALPYPLSESDIRQNITFASHIAQALTDMHTQGGGKCHLDVKSGNILLSSENDWLIPKLADFGLTKPTGGFLKSPCGTPAYMAPELFGNAKNAAPSMDAWSLGIICIELFYGLSANQFLWNKEVISAAHDFFNHSRHAQYKALWEHIGNDIKETLNRYPLIDEVIGHLLDTNPITRWTAQKAAEMLKKIAEQFG
jgi:serine/threonine protein kinase